MNWLTAVFIGGNGGANPRHALLFAQDVPPTKVVRILDRYVMFYIRTAEHLQRTAPWVESFDGGLAKLQRILIDDELGICADLEAEMASLVDSYEDEWKKAVQDPLVRSKFRQFVNTPERREAVEIVAERGQNRAADWPKEFPSQKFTLASLPPKSQWKWVPLAAVSDLAPNDENTTSAAVRYGKDSQLAIFHVPHKGYYATQQMCPHKRAFVLDHGIIGDKNGELYVSCPLHKRNFKLDNGDCINDADYSVLAFDVRPEGGKLLVRLPPEDELDMVIGASKWMVRKDTAKEMGGIAATAVGGCGGDNGGCGDPKLEW